MRQMSVIQKILKLSAFFFFLVWPVDPIVTGEVCHLVDIKITISQLHIQRGFVGRASNSHSQMNVVHHSELGKHAEFHEFQ